MTQPTTAPQTALELDATDQAVELLRKLSAGEGITGRGSEKDCAAVITAALIAQASETRNVGRLLEGLIDALQVGMLADALGVEGRRAVRARLGLNHEAELVIPTGDEDAEQTPD